MCNILESLIMELKVIQFNSHHKQTSEALSKRLFTRQNILSNKKLLNTHDPNIKKIQNVKYTCLNQGYYTKIMKNISVNWIKAGIK